MSQLLFKINSVKFNLHFLLFFFLILLGSYFIAPINWEPGGESFKNWVAARIFSETGGFPVMSITPLYNIYLQIFLLFDYPLSIQLEHFTTHIFTYVSIFILLKRFLPSIPAFFIVCAWIPWLWGIESGARILATGFFSLYLGIRFHSIFNRGYFPIFLLLAAFCDTGYFLILLLHIFFYTYENIIKKNKLYFKSLLKKNFLLENLIIILLFFLLIFTIFYQSPRNDNTVYSFNYPWSPVSQKNILTVTVFSCVNHTYALKNFEKNKLINADWYFTHKLAFNNAQNLISGFKENSNLMISHAIKNIKYISKVMPKSFLVGFSYSSSPIFQFFTNFLIIFAWIILPINIVLLYRYLKFNNALFQFYSILIGSLAIISVYVVGCLRDRYFVILLPVGLVYLSMSLQVLNLFIQSNIQKNKTEFYNFSYLSKILGLLCLLSVFFANEFVLVKLFFQDESIKYWDKITIWVIDFLLLLLGFLLIYKNSYFNFFIKKLFNYQFSFKLHNLCTVIVILISIFMLSQNSYLIKKFSSLEFKKNPYELSGTIYNVHEELLEIVNNKKTIALISPWIRSFAEIDIDEVYHALYLPPFEDMTGETRTFLNSLDVIIIDNEWNNKQPSIATQSYLRYKLHIQPFIEDAKQNGWQEKEIKGFGKVYIKN